MRSESASGGDSHCGEEEEEEGQAASCMCEALACNSTPLADYPPIVRYRRGSVHMELEWRCGAEADDELI